MFDEYQEMMDFVRQMPTRPSLLLHSCCAPCSTHVIDLLKNYFDITVFYSNDNIDLVEEFDKRLTEEKNYCKQFNIPVIEDKYDTSLFEKAIKGYEHCGEKSKRCYECYFFRLEKTVLKAKELKFDFFTTTLSISPHKVSQWINEIGNFLEQKYGVLFLYSDFKKEGGFQHSIELSKEYGLYRQDYCGCKYSKEERKNQRLYGKNKENHCKTS